jgi:hypothetical protein
MIFHQPKDKEEDLDIRESEEAWKRLPFNLKAEGILASAFYLVDPVVKLNNA